jgi:diacylglycerol kinase (ATP)
MRTVLILNPASGVSPLANDHKSPQESEETIINALRSHGIEPEVWYTTPEDPGSGLAKKAAEEGVETVIAAGGDGTQHEVAGGLIHSKSVLGIIPLGTMNNIAHSLEIPRDIEDACAIIADGSVSKIDVGTINEHIFMEVAGVGIEAAIFPAAEEMKSSKIGSTLHGILRGLITLLNFRPTGFKLAFDDHRSRSYQAVQISVCNSPYYGAKLRFAPRAVMDDGFLDALIYKNFSTLEYLRHAFAISRGKKVLEPKVTHRKIKCLSITSEQPVEIHADGVAKGYTPAMIRVLPGALRIHVPKKVAGGPNIVQPEQKRARYYQQSQSNKLNQVEEEKGGVHVNS